MKEKDDQRSPAHAVRKVNLKKNATEETNISIKLKLSAASCGESSILKEQYHSSFARLPRSKLRGMRSLPNSILLFSIFDY